MKQDQQIAQWLELTQYVHYIETMMEKSLRQQYNLSLKEFYVLYEINNAQGNKYKINDLIKVVDLSQSAMSRLINRLESFSPSYVTRNECLEDHRAMYIYLTEAGSEIINDASNTYANLLEKVDFNHMRQLTQDSKSEA
ncbi:MarR family winged helix-turn-helix transcriptional regulator [Staphylococcus kloosii]|jgi:DNA-binding MarR family transcriptional regulator|uniref:Transcriptional regulator n=1 Tax=Staphylococcus kloosii TaxID=29384 RepID=A0A921H0J4_9STAP|nr:winged helix DNA-binding protein [Staphylococcus kloosii]AVQ35220.1 MarR family transcriptional regulator [Staphylococcus kloosii]MBF7021155.1 winged helix DNA-binding protein [Staphylococcus kloosii]MBF7030431.1 winged helix DNA-binding protein [Staphylococcus kloosii]PNZ05183.1 MarR family transcriptional regulator [Staphylococcus kloosii]PTJ79684.1 MarR family transcriptional regulator [Staphylococcus kloosii]